MSARPNACTAAPTKASPARLRMVLGVSAPVPAPTGTRLDPAKYARLEREIQELLFSMGANETEWANKWPGKTKNFSLTQKRKRMKTLQAQAILSRGQPDYPQRLAAFESAKASFEAEAVKEVQRNGKEAALVQARAADIEWKLANRQNIKDRHLRAVEAEEAAAAAAAAAAQAAAPGARTRSRTRSGAR